MKRRKICVYAICKNEEQFAERWMDSMGEADLIVVTDTGSTDRTVEKLRAKGATVYIDKIDPWRFDTARNISLGHVPDDVDICVCTDLDEFFVAGWRDALEKAWTPDAVAGRYLYNWSLKPDGSPDVQFTISKIHVKEGYRWVCPVHECLRYTGQKAGKYIELPGIVLNHYPDHTKPRSSYLGLLELGVAENPLDDRMAYYLGREYMYRSQWEKCIEALKRHLSMPTAAWAEERCASMRWIAKAYDELGDAQQAYGWYFRAIAQAPGLRDPYAEFAMTAYRMKNWPLLYYLVKEAQKITEKSKVYVNMGYSWNERFDDLGAVCCYRLGLYEEALKHAQKAREINPGDKRLEENYRMIEKKLENTEPR